MAMTVKNRPLGCDMLCYDIKFTLLTQTAASICRLQTSVNLHSMAWAAVSLYRQYI
jgi:hypothetical protein